MFYKIENTTINTEFITRILHMPDRAYIYTTDGGELRVDDLAKLAELLDLLPKLERMVFPWEEHELDPDEIMEAGYARANHQ